MKKLVFPFLGVLMLGLSGCMDKSGNMQDFSYIPAIVGLDFSTTQPELITSVGDKLLAPTLPLFSELHEGDAILTFFTIYYDQQPSTDYIIVSDLNWVNVTKKSSQPTPEGASTTGDFDTPIESMEVFDVITYDGGYRTVMFLVFQHLSVPNDQEFEYEMTYDFNYNSSETDDLPVIYIRAKKKGESSKATANVAYFYAFDMSNFISKHSGSEKEISFNLYYKTGEEDEDDVYKEWSENPVRIRFE